MGPEERKTGAPGPGPEEQGASGTERKAWRSEDEREEEGYGQPESSAQKLPQRPDDEPA